MTPPLNGHLAGHPMDGRPIDGTETREVLKQARSLLGSYQSNGPRYTSYPTAPHFSTGAGAVEYRQILSTTRHDGAQPDPFALYIHVPFCQERCAYCGCFVIPTRKRIVADRYANALSSELRTLAQTAGGPPAVCCIHLGGGTPTYLGNANLESLFQTLRAEFRLLEEAEIAVEIDPRVTDPEVVQKLRDLGVNRVSIGVQDTSAEVQEAIGRHQSWEQTLDVIAAISQTEIDLVNVDLVYGLPRQTVEGLLETITNVLSTVPDRIAAYGYAHVPWLKPNQRSIPQEALPEPAERVEMFFELHRRLTSAGYVHVGMDHFARADDELAKAQRERRLGRSFMGYTPYRGVKVLGAGTSAIGDLQSAYFQNGKNLSQYYRAVESSNFAVERGLICRHDDVVRRFVIHGLMCDLELPFAAFERRFGVEFATYFAEELETLAPFEQDGLVEINSGGIRVSEVGRLFLRNVAMVFDRYLKQPSASRRYSPTV